MEPLPIRTTPEQAQYMLMLSADTLAAILMAWRKEGL